MYSLTKPAHLLYTLTRTDVYQQVIPETVEKMVGSILEGLRKPSRTAAETSEIAARLRSRKQRSIAGKT
jgi:hypothetical protein